MYDVFCHCELCLNGSCWYKINIIIWELHLAIIFALHWSEVQWKIEIKTYGGTGDTKLQAERLAIFVEVAGWGGTIPAVKEMLIYGVLAMTYRKIVMLQDSETLAFIHAAKLRHRRPSPEQLGGAPRISFSRQVNVILC